jgi:hypothetical protein
MEDSLLNTEKRKTKRYFSVFKRTFPMHVSFFLSRAGNQGIISFKAKKKSRFFWWNASWMVQHLLLLLRRRDFVVRLTSVLKGKLPEGGDVWLML